MGKPSQNYDVSRKRAHPTLTPASKVGTQFTYPREIKG